eukprot:scaffold298386_cov17-Tisochrysis_lutea.AAC.1
MTRRKPFMPPPVLDRHQRVTGAEVQFRCPCGHGSLQAHTILSDEAQRTHRRNDEMRAHTHEMRCVLFPTCTAALRMQMLSSCCP